MAEEKKHARIRKTETMREKTQKTEKDTAKPKRIRSTASVVKRPLKAASQGLKQEYHLFPQKDTGVWGFLTKTRRVTPSYFRSAFAELKQVTWPSRKETWRLVLAVFLFATTFGLVIAGVDFILDKLFKAAFL